MVSIITKWRAEDGSLFDNKDDAEEHELQLSVSEIIITDLIMDASEAMPAAEKILAFLRSKGFNQNEF